MKYLSKLWRSMMAKRALSMVLCAILTATSASVCAATGFMPAGRQAEAGAQPVVVDQDTGFTHDESAEDEEKAETDGKTGTIVQPETHPEAEEDEEEASGGIHEFTGAWVGYECSLKDLIGDYNPGDEVRIQAVFNKPVGSQFGLYIDGAWNGFPGEGKVRNIVLIPDSDYLNIQITDMKGLSSVKLTDISAEIIRKGDEDNGNYLHKFTGLWQGFETKFSDYNPDYEPGDQVKVTVTYNKKVTSQMGINLNGQWTSESGEGKELVKVITPDNDYLNIQISDMWASYSVGIVSISVEITEKGPGVSSYGGGLTGRNYTEPGDYLLFSGDANETYSCNDEWIKYCADTDYLTLTYDCAPEHENWGVLGWQATVDGVWTDGPSYSADSRDSTKELSQTFSVKYLRRMLKITEESSISSLSLGAWSEGRIKELVLHVGSEISRDQHLFLNGEPNQAWVCTDIERILDLPDDKYICVQYKCATPDYEGWTVLSWGASVDGQWMNGKSYKTSNREATRNHFTSMSMQAFRNMLHLSWDVRVDTITLAAYNDAQILDIWISDTKVEDPGDSKKDKVAKESHYSSGNSGTYTDISKKDGYTYPQNISLTEWEWTAGDKSLKNEKKIIKQLKKGSYLIVEYSPENAEAPNLQLTMAGGKQQQVTPSYLTGNQAIFSYRDVAAAVPDYLVPQEIENLQISAEDCELTIEAVRVIWDDAELVEEPIAVLTKSWSGFGTEISKYHSGYEVGDTVTVTVTFDKKAPGMIAFNIGGQWSAGGMETSKTITRTAKPDGDHFDVQIGEMPENKRFVKIMDIKVEIEGKKNFDEFVKLEGDTDAAMLAMSKKEAALAALTDEEVNQGTKLVLNLEKSEPMGACADRVKALFGEDADKVKLAAALDIEAYKEKSDDRIQISETNDALRFKMPVPDGIESSEYDFAVIRDCGGKLTFLEDLDGDPDTVTFRSKYLSRFIVVYGEQGAFDSLSGALKVFREEWQNFGTNFSTYFEKYQPGNPAKVTLTFDKPVKSYIDINAPSWTRIEGKDISTTFTAEVTASDDGLGIGIASLNGNATVKLLSVKIEQEEVPDESLHTFTSAWSGFETSFAEYKEDYKAGLKTTVTLTFDKEVRSQFSYNAPSWTTEEGSGYGTTMTGTVTPGDDYLNIQIMDMNGNEEVKLLSVVVEQDGENVWNTLILSEEPIYVFENTETASVCISDFTDEDVVGKQVSIRLTLLSKGAFQAAAEEKQNSEDQESKATPSDAEKLKATPSDAAAVKEVSTATPSDAAQADAALPDATPSNAACEMNWSDQDGQLELIWSGVLESDELAVIVSSLTDGCPVYLDSIAVTTKEDSDAGEDSSDSAAGDIPAFYKKEDEDI